MHSSLVQYTSVLLCPVRACRKPLKSRERMVFCENRHSFDIARSGYINLLQPQDRRSKNPGDMVSAVEGRRRLYDRGAVDPLLKAIAEMASPVKEDTVLDVGCGEGFYLGKLHQDVLFDGWGLDISVPSVDAAARRYSSLQWIVANADRMIPCADQSFSLILSITARMNPPEFHRVMKNDGRLLIAVSAPDDLQELRSAEGRDRTERTVKEFSHHFSLVKQERKSTTAVLDTSAAEGVAASIYRPRSITPNQKSMALTFSLDLLLFQKKNP